MEIIKIDRKFPDLKNYREIWLVEDRVSSYEDKPNLDKKVEQIDISVSEILKGGTKNFNISTYPQYDLFDYEIKNLTEDIIKIENDKVKGISSGIGKIRVSVEGKVNYFPIYVKKNIPDDTLRLHYKRLSKDYEGWSIELTGQAINIDSMEATGIAKEGIYFDIPIKDENSSIEFKFVNQNSEKEAIEDYRIISKLNETNELWLMEREDIVFTSPYEQDEGAFKFANSWGVGFKNENKKDGFIYMTYDAMKKEKTWVYTYNPRIDYKPKALAVFKILHEYRNDLIIYFENENGEVKYFRQGPRYFNGEEVNPEGLIFYNPGEYGFTSENIVFDITKLMPSKKIEMYVKDINLHDANGMVEKFKIEIYNNEEKLKEYSAYNDLPMETLNGDEITLTINGIDENLIQKRVNKRARENKMYVDLNKKDKSDLLNDFDPLLGTKEDIESLIKSGKLKKLTKRSSFQKRNEDPPYIDLSQEKYFPPIGNQGSKGSCVSWSMGYYMMSYHQAKNKDIDIRNEDIQNSDKLMSPDFIYSLINNGEDSGSHYSDNMTILSNIGISSIDTMRLNEDDYYSWPSELSWREATKNRSSADTLLYKRVENDEDIEIIKNLLKDGYPLAISIDSRSYISMDQDDTWTSENYFEMGTNHANTIVGYYDNELWRE